MYDYRIRVKKQNKDEVLEEYPNLTAPIWLTAKVISTKKDLSELKEKKIKKLIKSQLKKGMRTNPDYPFEKKETVDIVPDEPKEEDESREDRALFTGKIKIPKKYRGGNTPVNSR